MEKEKKEVKNKEKGGGAEAGGVAGRRRTE